ncbi:MAG: hypothetical protein Q9227_006793 [Pyrenula ochraceoflavens]
MDDSDHSLRATFDNARQKQKALETGSDLSTSSSDETLRQAITELEECVSLISRLSIFSSNESLEDVTTADIRYLATEYFLAQLLLRCHWLDRATILQRVLSLYRVFLGRLKNYELLSTSDTKLYERFSESPTMFTLASTDNPAQRRERKIARFKEEQRLKSQLKLLSEHQNGPQVDDETIRKYSLAEIELCAHQSFPDLDNISQELNMLSQAATLPTPPEPSQDQRSRPGLKNNEYSERLDRPLRELIQGRRGGPLLDSKGKPLQPFTITDRRTQLREGVFRSGHNLPTMSIDEYLEEEKRRNGVVQGGNNEQPENVDEDDMDKADQETMKARAWDEFTEENPKGAGNTLNRG